MYESGNRGLDRGYEQNAIPGDEAAHYGLDRGARHAGYRHDWRNHDSPTQQRLDAIRADIRLIDGKRRNSPVAE